MKLFVLMGLLSIEKMQLAGELAWHFHERGQSVTVLDNIARLAIDSETLPVLPQRLAGDALSKLLDAIAQADSDVVIVALSERAEPAATFVALDGLTERVQGLQMHTIAMIDLRTCDCFPHVREALEMHADISLLMPYSLAEVLEAL